VAQGTCAEWDVDESESRVSVAKVSPERRYATLDGVQKARHVAEAQWLQIVAFATP